MTWELGAKCPHCSHRAALHSGPDAAASEPGTCHEQDPGTCGCPGWHPLLEGVTS